MSLSHLRRLTCIRVTRPKPGFPVENSFSLPLVPVDLRRRHRHHRREEEEEVRDEMHV